MSRLLSDETDSGLKTADFPHIRGYEILDLIGAGGGGTVYLAVREGSERLLALKLFRDPLGGGDVTQRAWRELDLLSRLQLDCVPRVIDYALHDEHLYIATEYIQGKPLDDFIQSRPLDTSEKIKLVIRIAEALQLLHDRGIIHRDIKPRNIIIKADGSPVIIDFGISLAIRKPGDTAANNADTVLGTPAFMAPEQAGGQVDLVSVRSDVYSLAATAYWILAGNTPYDTSGPRRETLNRLTTEQPRDPQLLNPDLDEDIAAVLLRAVSPDPETRTPSMRVFIEDLQACLEGRPLLWTKPARRKVWGYWIRTHKATLAWLAATVFALAIAAGSAGVAMSNAALARKNAEVAREKEKLAQDSAALADAWQQWYRVKYLPTEFERAEAAINIADKLLIIGKDRTDPQWKAAVEKFERLRNELYFLKEQSLKDNPDNKGEKK